MRVFATYSLYLGWFSGLHSVFGFFRHNVDELSSFSKPWAHIFSIEDHEVRVIRLLTVVEKPIVETTEVLCEYACPNKPLMEQRSDSAVLGWAVTLEKK